MEEREKHAKDAEEPAKEAKAVAQEAHDKAEAELKMAADEVTRRAAELEYGKIDSDQDGEVTVEEVTFGLLTIIVLILVVISIVPVFILCRMIMRKKFLALVFGCCRYIASGSCLDKSKSQYNYRV